MWVSPAGCLQFSLLLRAPLSLLPPNRLVFIQYLFGIAVVNACRRLLGTAGEKVRLKWPNDVYAVLDTFDEFGRKNGRELKKLGGILVTTNISGGEIDIVIGEGGLFFLFGRKLTCGARLWPECIEQTSYYFTFSTR